LGRGCRSDPVGSIPQQYPGPGTYEFPENLPLTQGQGPDYGEVKKQPGWKFGTGIRTEKKDPGYPGPDNYFK